MLPRTPAATSPAPNGNHNESFGAIAAGFEDLPSNFDDVPFDASGNSGPTERSIVVDDADHEEGLWHFPASISQSDAIVLAGLERFGEKSSAPPYPDMEITWPEWLNMHGN